MQARECRGMHFHTDSGGTYTFNQTKMTLPGRRADTKPNAASLREPNLIPQMLSIGGTDG
jgi:hypothetical protein